MLRGDTQRYFGGRLEGCAKVKRNSKSSSLVENPRIQLDLILRDSKLNRRIIDDVPQRNRESRERKDLARRKKPNSDG